MGAAPSSRKAKPVPGRVRKVAADDGEARAPRLLGGDAFMQWHMGSVKDAWRRMRSMPEVSYDARMRMMITRRQFVEVFTDYSTVVDKEFLRLPIELYSAFSGDLRQCIAEEPSDADDNNRDISLRDRMRRRATRATVRKANEEAKQRRAALADLTSLSTAMLQKQARAEKAESFKRKRSAARKAGGASKRGSADSQVKGPLLRAFGSASSGSSAGGAGSAPIETRQQKRERHRQRAMAVATKLRGKVDQRRAMQDPAVAATLSYSAAVSGGVDTSAEWERERAEEMERAEGSTTTSVAAVNAIEVFLALTLFCDGEHEDQLRFCFTLFDADDNDGLDVQEMTHFVHTLASACFRVRMIHELPDADEISRLAASMFLREAGKASGAATGDGDGAAKATGSRKAGGVDSVRARSRRAAELMASELSAAQFVEWAKRDIIGRRITSAMDEMREAEEERARLARTVRNRPFGNTARATGQLGKFADDGKSASFKRLQQMEMVDKALLAHLENATTFSLRELQDLHARFTRHCVKAGSGVVELSRLMFRDVMLEQWPNLRSDPNHRRNIDHLFVVFDRDNSGSIDFREFTLGLSKITHGTLDEKLAFLFQVISATDVNTGEAGADVQELLKFVQSGSGELMEDLQLSQELLGTMDEDGDGTVSFDEFSSRLKQDPVLLECFASALSVPGLAETELQKRIASLRDSNARFDLRFVKDLWSRFSRDATQLSSLSATESPVAAKGAERHALRRGSTYSALRHRVMRKTDFRKLMQDEFKTDQEALPLVDRVWDLMDKKGSGVVSFQQLFAGLAQMCTTSQEERAEFYFRLYDVDGNGAVDREELMALLMASQTSASEAAQRVTALLEELDADGDGEITLEEFKNATLKDPDMIELFGRLFGVGNEVVEAQEGSEESEDEIRELATAIEATLSCGLRGRGRVGVEGGQAEIRSAVKGARHAALGRPDEGWDDVGVDDGRMDASEVARRFSTMGIVMGGAHRAAARLRRRKKMSRAALERKAKREAADMEAAEKARQEGIARLHDMPLDKLEEVVDALTTLEAKRDAQLDAIGRSAVKARVRARVTPETLPGACFPMFGKSAAEVAVAELRNRTASAVRRGHRALHASVVIEEGYAKDHKPYKPVAAALIAKHAKRRPWKPKAAAGSTTPSAASVRPQSSTWSLRSSASSGSLMRHTAGPKGGGGSLTGAQKRRLARLVPGSEASTGTQSAATLPVPRAALVEDEPPRPIAKIKSVRGGLVISGLHTLPKRAGTAPAGATRARSGHQQSKAHARAAAPSSSASPPARRAPRGGRREESGLATPTLLQRDVVLSPLSTDIEYDPSSRGADATRNGLLASPGFVGFAQAGSPGYPSDGVSPFSQDTMLRYPPQSGLSSLTSPLHSGKRGARNEAASQPAWAASPTTTLGGPVRESRWRGASPF